MRLVLFPGISGNSRRSLGVREIYAGNTEGGKDFLRRPERGARRGGSRHVRYKAGFIIIPDCDGVYSGGSKSLGNVGFSPYSVVLSDTLNFSL